MCLPWTSICRDMPSIEGQIGHGEAVAERDSARSVCLGRRDEQNRKRDGKWGYVGTDAIPFSVPVLMGEK